MELNGLDVLVAGAQSLVVASLFYFCFLVVRYGESLQCPQPAAEGRAAPERTRDAIVAMWKDGAANDDRAVTGRSALPADLVHVDFHAAPPRVMG